MTDAHDTIAQVLSLPGALLALMFLGGEVIMGMVWAYSVHVELALRGEELAAMKELAASINATNERIARAFELHFSRSVMTGAPP